jgi:hypothetical protein
MRIWLAALFIGGCFGLALSSTTGMISEAEAQETCKCYCGGQNWSPGAVACMGGLRYVCNARGGGGTTDCGWDPMKSGADFVRCNGGEHCQ